MSKSPSSRPLFSIVFSTLFLLAVACSGDSEEEQAPAPIPTTAPSAPALPPTTGSTPSLPPPVPPGVNNLIVALASTDLAVGDNRVAFGLISQGTGAVKDAKVDVQTFLLTPDGPDGPKQTVPATFENWPGNTGGVYVADLTFGQAGEWGLGLVTLFPDGSSIPAGTRVQVKETSSTPSLGSPAPRSEQKTARDVSDLKDLTTDLDPDPDLYQKTIAEALDEGKPLLVSFATPAYCQTATCGPQVGIIKNLKTDHSDEMNFIHVEVYDNPPEIREQGIAAARTAPVLAEWGLPSEPWTFITDNQGIIRAKYEGFVNTSELQSAIADVLQ